MVEKNDDLAFEYALNLLPQDEVQEAEHKFKSDPQFKAAVLKWRQELTSLDHALVPQKPPARVWNNIEKTLFPKAKWSFGSMFLPSAAAFAGLLLVVMVSILMLQNPYQAKLGDEWMVKADINQGMLTLAAMDPAPMPDNMVCHLWIKDENNQLMKVGVLPMKDKKTMDLKQNKGLYDMFKQKATLLVSMDNKDEEVEEPKKPMYTVAWL